MKSSVSIIQMKVYIAEGRPVREPSILGLGSDSKMYWYDYVTGTWNEYRDYAMKMLEESQEKVDG